MLASAGGVTVSYFEWVQNNQGYYWSEEEVNEKLREKLVEAFDTIYELSQNRRIDMRLAAYIVGIKRTAGSCSLSWLGIKYNNNFRVWDIKFLNNVKRQFLLKLFERNCLFSIYR